MHTIIDASERFRGKSAGGLYGDVVEEFDFETGRLLDTLDKQGLRDNTLVIYTSDNGPWNQPAYTDKKKGHPKGSIFWGEAGPLRNGKGSCYEAGVRVPCIVRWPGKTPAGQVSDAIFSTLDFMPTFLYRNNGIRRGKWKYLKAKHNVYGYARDRKREEAEELYDLDADIGETKNLAADNPELIAELKQLMEKIAIRK